MAASTKKVRGITIKLDADTQGIAEAYGKLTSHISKAQKSLTDVNKLLSDATPAERIQLLTMKQNELANAILATKARIEAEQKWLAELEQKDSTPEVIRAHEALERQIIDDSTKLQEFQQQLSDITNVNSVENLTNQMVDLDTRLGESLDRVKDLNKQIASSEGTAKVEALNAKHQELANAVSLAQEKLAVEQKLLAEISKRDTTPSVVKQQKELEKQIEKDAKQVESLQKELKEAGDAAVIEPLKDAIKNIGSELDYSKEKIRDFDRTIKNSTGDEKIAAINGKQEELNKAIELSQEKLQNEEKLLRELKNRNTTGEVTREQRELEKQIERSKKETELLQQELKEIAREATLEPLRKSVADVNKEYDKSREKLEEINAKIGSTKGRERIEALKEKQVELNKAFDLSKEKIEREKALLAELEKSDSTPEIVQEQEKLREALEKDEAEFEELSNAVRQWGSLAKQEALAVADDFERIGSKLDSIGSKMRNAGSMMTATVTLPILKAGKSLYELSTDFESAMAKVRSVTLGATTEQMDQLADAAINLSESSKFSATEAADALYYMGLAGWDAAEMMSALPNVLNLAAAGDMDLARASDIVTDYVTAFGLTADESTRLVDVMAKTMANSNTDIDQMGQAFSYVAPVAGALGYSVEDVSHALGLMANNGIKGSKAGTSLRMLMSRLAKPTQDTAAAMKYLGISLSDQEGNAYTFREILDQLRESLSDLPTPTEHFQEELAELDSQLEEGSITEEDYSVALDELINRNWEGVDVEKARLAATLAGTRALSGMLAIVNTTEEEYEGLYKIIGDSTGATKEIAEVMLDTTEGAMAKMKHQLENIGREFGDMLIPYIEKGIYAVKDIAKQFRNMSDSTKDTILKIALVVAAIGPLLAVGGTLLSGVGKLTTAIGGIITLFATHPILATIGAAATLIGGLAIAAHNAAQKHKEEIAELYGLTDAQEEVIDRVKDLKASYDDLTDTRERRLSVAEDEINKNKGLLESLRECADANGTIKDGMEWRAKYIAGELSDAYGIEIKINDGIISKYQEVVDAIEDIIEAKRREAIMSAYEPEYQEALAKSGEAASAAAYALGEYNKQVELEKEYQEKAAEALALMNEYVGTDTKKHQEAQAAYERYTEAAQAAHDAQSDLWQAYQDAIEISNEYQVTIENYGEVMEAVASGSTEAMNFALTKLTNNFKTANTATQAELTEQLGSFRTQYQYLKQAVADGMPGVTQEMVDQMGNLVKAAEAELYGLEFKLPVPEPPTPEQLKTVRERAGLLAKEAIDAFSGVSAYDSGAYFAKGFAQGIEDNISAATSAATRMANKAKEVPNYILDIGSPSREMAKTGRFFTEGFAIGIADEEREAINAAAEMARSAMAAVGTPSFGGNWNTPFGGGNVNNTTYGAINVTVNGANTSNADELAQIIADRINREVNHRKLVTA